MRSTQQFSKGIILENKQAKKIYMIEISENIKLLFIISKMYTMYAD